MWSKKCCAFTFPGLLETNCTGIIVLGVVNFQNIQKNKTLLFGTSLEHFKTKSYTNFN